MQNAPPTVARPSLASLLLESRFEGTALGTATGFGVKRDGKHYLITNWHVVSGRRPDTGAPLSSTGGTPDELTIWHHTAGQLGSWTAKTDPLYDSHGSPRWLEHSVHGRKVDVVALELADLNGVEIYAHDPWSSGPGLAVGVARPLSIVGFPFGLTGGGVLGIWVQGAVATEPNIDYNGLPCFLIDSRTRPGQSGSPVIAYAAGGVVPLQNGSSALFSGPVEQFIGVYSGRINQRSDLGYVWKKSVVCDIIASGVPGTI